MVNVKVRWEMINIGSCFQLFRRVNWLFVCGYLGHDKEGLSSKTITYGLPLPLLSPEAFWVLFCHLERDNLPPLLIEKPQSSILGDSPWEKFQLGNWNKEPVVRSKFWSLIPFADGQWSCPSAKGQSILSYWPVRLLILLSSSQETKVINIYSI